MGIRISLVITVSALFSYYHIEELLQQQTLDKLQNYITERTAKESAIFKLAEDNHLVFSQAFLEAWSERKSSRSSSRFDQLFIRDENGTTRLSNKAFTGYERHSASGYYLGQSKWISGFIGRGAPIDSAEFQNRLLLSYDLVDAFGLSWSNRFANTYVSMPEGVNIVYWPELNWAEGASADLDIPKEEWVYIANKENNPTRESVWTGLYYDQTADEWMVSCETPVDDANGQHLINIGHDILLNNVFQRVFNDHLKGAHNFIIRADGRLIAHPAHIDELTSRRGLLSVDELSNEEVISQFESMQKALKQHGDTTTITFDEKTESFLAFKNIDGPEWIFVTVYPKTLLTSPALDTALFIFMLGLVSLFVELIMLYLVLVQKILTPMTKFEGASKLIQQGDYNLHPALDSLTELRHDEVGSLAETMISMADCINDHEIDLENQINQRTQQLEEAKQLAEKQARTDPLTNLGNRRAFFELGSLEFDTARTNKQPLSIIMVDLDRFKFINDNYGHAAGDKVLKECAAAIVALLRPSDLCARLGGEEFGVLLPRTNLDGAECIAERIRKKLKTLRFVEDGKHFQLTASFGVAEVIDIHTHLETIIKDADIALYQAKEAGRDRVVKCEYV